MAINKKKGRLDLHSTNGECHRIIRRQTIAFFLDLCTGVDRPGREILQEALAARLMIMLTGLWIYNLCNVQSEVG